MDNYNISPNMATDIARKAIPFMAEKGVPITPKNYFVWFEYFRGAMPDLRAFLDDLISHNVKFESRLNDEIYSRFFIRDLSQEAERKLELEMKTVDEVNAAAKNLLEPIAKDLKSLSETNFSFGDKLSDYAEEIEKKVDSEQISEIIVSLLEDTKKIATDNKNISSQLETYTVQINDLRQSLAKAKSEARIDDLTQIGNRRAFNESIAEEMKWMEKNKAVSCLALLDIDLFKRINDQYGHSVGDKALQVIARQTKGALRVNGEVFRYGGEEFAVILSGFTLEEGMELMDRVRQTIFENEFVIRDKTEEITVSGGVALLKADRSPEESQRLADEALYLAKKSGRNNIKSELDLK